MEETSGLKERGRKFPHLTGWSRILQKREKVKQKGDKTKINISFEKGRAKTDKREEKRKEKEEEEEEKRKEERRKGKRRSHVWNLSMVCMEL